MNFFRIGVLAVTILNCSLMLSAKEIAARLNYRICLPDAPSIIESMAAKELAAYLEKSYTENICLNDSTKPILFSVGFAPEATEFSKAKDGFTSSGFGVFCRKRTILLTGLDDPGVKPGYGHEEGTLLSVYYFLRRYTGLKIYAPDPVHGEKPGKNTALKLPQFDKPQFSFSVRGIGTAFTDVPAHQMKLYSRKQLCHIPYWANHNIYYVVLNSWGKRFKEQPELLGLHKGKRQSLRYPYHLPCLTNPKVKEVIVKDILETIRKNKLEKKAVLRIFCDAPFKRCECANCARISSRHDYFYGFILSVRDAVKKHYPETRLFLQEKGSSHQYPPSAGNLKDVVVDISTGYPAKMDYRSARGLFRKWLDRGALPTIRLYARYPKWQDCPIINPHDIAANFRAMKGIAIGQRSSDCSPSARTRIPYAFVSLTNYVHVNCLLDADADTDKLIRDFCSFMYPGAAKEMVAFYNWMEKRQENLGTWDDPYFRCYTSSALEYPFALLDAAAKKCTAPFWLNKLRKAFDNFRNKTRKYQHLTGNFEKNMQLVEQQRSQFQKRFSKPFRFSSEKTVFPLCPMDVPLDEIQDSTVKVQIRNGRLEFQLTAMEKRLELLRKSASKEKPENIWGDDCFEILISPGKQDFPYLHLAVNANGAVMARRCFESANQWIKQPAEYWKAHGRISGTNWSAGLAVPLPLIREICPDGRGRIGIFRTRALNAKTPEMRSFYSAHSGLDAKTPVVVNYHNVSRYHDFTLQ